MSKFWKPNRHTVELRPSRIRRDPPPSAVDKQTMLSEDSESETWAVIIGVVAFALAISFLIFWVSDYTSSRHVEPITVTAAS